MANHRKLWDAKLRGLKRKSGQPGYQISLFKFLKKLDDAEKENRFRELKIES